MGEDKRLTDYLLGNLSEPEEMRLEEEYFSDPEVQDRLLIAEDELIDAYLQGELSTQERKQLEARFLASSRGSRKLALAKSLMVLAAAQKPVPGQKSKPRSIFSMGWAFAAAAVLLLLFVLGWSVKEKVWQHSGAERAGGQQNPAYTPMPPSVPATQTPRPSENSTEHPQSAVMASIILRPTARNIEQPSQIKIPRDALQMKVQLDLEADNHESYKAALLDAEDHVKWSARGLKSQAAASGRALVVKLPAALFKTGEYTFLLSPDEDSARPIAEYTFAVQKN